MKKTQKLEVVLWSIAFPGFGQLLNGHVMKGFLFVLLEFIINSMSTFNLSIMYSFLGRIEEAGEVIHYQWIMFYPCVYMYAMYDAYKFSDGENPALSFIPFAFAAYFVTVGIMYSPHPILSVHFGPIWLPMLALIPGLAAGFIIRAILLRFTSFS